MKRIELEEGEIAALKELLDMAVRAAGLQSVKNVNFFVEKLDGAKTVRKPRKP